MSAISRRIEFARPRRSHKARRCANSQAPQIKDLRQPAEGESLLCAREMGYTRAALKACKGRSQSLPMAAAAQKFGMFLCVQDLTCPGASLIDSAGLAAHIPTVAATVANAREYVPRAAAPIHWGAPKAQGW